MESQRDVRNAVDQLLHVFQQGFEPFVTTAIKSVHGTLWLEVLRATPDLRISAQHTPLHLDATALVRIMIHHWDSTFGRILTTNERNMLYEVRHIRNKWAHQSTIHIDDVDRLADNITRLLNAINAANAIQAKQLRESLRAQRYHQPVMLGWMKWTIGVVILVMSIGGVWYWWTQSAQSLPSSPTRVIAPKATPDSAAAAPCAAGQIKANKRTMIYHMPDGAYYAITKNSDVVCYDSVADVEAAGFRRSKR